METHASGLAEGEGVLTFSVIIIDPRTGLKSYKYSQDITNYVNGQPAIVIVENATVGEVYILRPEARNHFGAVEPQKPPIHFFVKSKSTDHNHIPCRRSFVCSLS